MKNLTLIAKTTLALAVTFVLFGMQNRTLAADIELKDGTPVRLKLAQTITSADAKPGQLVSFEVLEDVKVGGSVVIKQGTLVVATVTQARSKKIFGRKGQLSLRFDSVKAVDGTQVSLRSMEGKILKINQPIENSKTGEGIVSGIVKTLAFASGMSAMPVAAASNLLLKKGKDVGIAPGQLIDVFVESSAVIKVKSQIVPQRSMPNRLNKPARRNKRL